MDPGKNSKNIDQTDHSYPYKNEVSLSIGDDNNQTAIITPTPSPRQYKSDEFIVPSNTNIAENVSLKQNGHNPDDSRIGLDNPAFETETKTPRPLSSFGQNGHGDTKVPNTNGTEKPLAGKIQSFTYTFLLICIN